MADLFQKEIEARTRKGIALNDKGELDEAMKVTMRKEIETLFKEEGKFGRDVVRYVDIALDLGQPGFAALLYWNALTCIKPEAYGKPRADPKKAPR